MQIIKVIIKSVTTNLPIQSNIFPYVTSSSLASCLTSRFSADQDLSASISASLYIIQSSSITAPCSYCLTILFHPILFHQLCTSTFSKVLTYFQCLVPRVSQGNLTGAPPEVVDNSPAFTLYASIVKTKDPNPFQEFLNSSYHLQRPV